MKIKLTEKHKLVNKAFKVGSRDQLDCITPDEDGYEIVYADNASDAKYTYLRSHSDVSYIQLRARRSASDDKYIFQGRTAVASHWQYLIDSEKNRLYWINWEGHNRGLPCWVYSGEYNMYWGKDVSYTKLQENASVYDSSEALGILLGCGLEKQISLKLAFTYRPPKEVSSMMRKLERERRTVSAFNLFGENQSDEYRASIEVLRDKMTPNEIRMKFKAANVVSHALNTHNWLIGQDVKILLIDEKV